VTYGPEEFLRDTDVSRETLERFKSYADLLARWQRRINLVSNATLSDTWHRHFLDSVQIEPYIPRANSEIWDVGAGAGFPGLALAVMGISNITLIESDVRKCAFLREAARVTETTVTIVNERMGPQISHPEDSAAKPNIIVSSAVAPIAKFLDVVSNQIICNTCCILHRGKRHKEELLAARRCWRFEHEVHASMTHPDGVILVLRNIQRSAATK